MSSVSQKAVAKAESKIFFVTLAKFEARTDADALMDKLGPKLGDIRVETIDTINQGPRYRVASGNFDNYQEADKRRTQVVSMGVSAVIESIPLVEIDTDNDERYLQPSGDARQRANTLSRRPGDRRPENQFQVDFFNRPLTIGGEWGTTTQERKDFRLDGAELDDLVRTDLELDVEFFYPVNKSVFVFLEGKLEYQKDLDTEDSNSESKFDVARGETWAYFANLFDTNFSLQVGRQHFRDKREWWWDEELDAVRLHYDRENVHAEVSLAQDFLSTVAGERLDPERKDVFRILGNLVWEWSPKQRLEFYAIQQRDNSGFLAEDTLLNPEFEDEADADLAWVGVRARGRYKFREIKALNRIYYWMDYGVVRGSETVIDYDDFDVNQSIVDDIVENDVSGWAVDVGFTWQSRLKFQPRVTLGYAFGSGDRDPNDNDNRAFRQTGLQDNNGKFRGVDRFRYYGELLRPELSNLKIATVSLGAPLLTNSSFELAVHDYQQVYPVNFFRDGRIDAPLTGLSGDIGNEINLVVGLEEWTHVEIELVAAVFRAGKAYGELDGEIARHLIFKMDYNF